MQRARGVHAVLSCVCFLALFMSMPGVRRRGPSHAGAWLPDLALPAHAPVHGTLAPAPPAPCPGADGIYREDILLRDGGACFQGINNYKAVMASVRLCSLLLFRERGVSVIRMWDAGDDVIK